MKKSKPNAAPAPASAPILVNLKAAALALGCSTRTVRERVYRDELRCVKGLGKSWLFAPDDLKAFADRLLRAA